MAKLRVREIQQEALGIIAANPGGIRYGELTKTIQERHPETPVNTIHGSV